MIFEERRMKNYSFYDNESCPESDLALERRRADIRVAGVEYREDRAAIGRWERIKITTDEGARSIGRPIGLYDTLTIPRMDGLDYDGIDDARNEVATELCRMFDANHVYPERILVVGLGNASLTPDAVGSLAAKNVEATMHIRAMDEVAFEALDCSEIATLRPGAASESGIEAADVVIGICTRIRPDAVIAIDALASRAPERLGTTIQLSDTGIIPGGGLGTPHSAINEHTVGVPVIAIGVPTVIDSRLLSGEARADVPRMFVAPKEIDEIVKKAAEIIGGGINQAFGIFS